MIRLSIRFLFAVLLIAFAGTAAVAAESGPLRAGAAKVDITSPPDALPFGYTSIHDHVYARAIVLDNGKAKAVLLAADLGMFTEDSWEELTQQIMAEVGCPLANIIMTGTHTHSSPSPGAKPSNVGFSAGTQTSNVLDSFDPVYAARIKKSVFEAVRLANQRIQPARVGYGTGQFYLNVNRDAINPETRTWYQGPNTDGPSDKTVAVLKFENLKGEPIAVYVNYAMHAVLMFMRNQISGDFPGATSRYLEEVYDDKIVALWTSGAAGGQNPLYLRMAEPAIVAQKREYVEKAGLTADVHSLMDFTGAKLDPKMLALNARLVDSIGQLLGEEVIRVMGNIKRTSSEVVLGGVQESVSCPVRRRTNTGREGAPGTYEDADPVNIRLTLLMIDRTALAAVTGEVYTMIWQRLKRTSPFEQTMLVALANGKSAGYIPSDDSYGHNTFQVLGTRFKPGCAENAIINGFLDMMDQYK